MIRRMVLISAGVIAALTLLLLVDWAVATVRQPKDDKLVKDMQEQVKNDAAFAPKLAAEQKRVTDYRKSRKRRDSWAGNGLIAAGIVFLVYARRNRPRRVPGAPQRATRLGDSRGPLPDGRGSDQNHDHQNHDHQNHDHQSHDHQSHDHPCHDHPSHDREGVVSIDVAFVDETVARLGRTREAAIPLLQAIQTHYRYLPDEALRRLCEITDITPAQVSGTSSFYGQFRRSPVGEHIVKVCHGTACHVAGARQITDELRRYLAIPEGQDTDASRQFTLEEVACVGCCSLAPVLMVDDKTAGRLTPTSAAEALRPFEKEPV